MALQDNIISCGTGLTVYGLVMRFVIGPATSALGAMLLRLHGDVLKIAIVQVTRRYHFNLIAIISILSVFFY